MNFKSILKHLFTWPTSPEGRKMRIDRLMQVLEEERDVCAAIVYTRDLYKKAWMLDEEVEDFKRIAERIVKGEITLPVERRRNGLSTSN